MKEPVFIGGVELVDLDDCDVTNRKLQCDSTNSDDDESPNAVGVGVRDGPGSCSKTMDSSNEPAARSVVPEVGEYFEPYTMPIAFIDDALFNAVGKAPHPDAVIVKQEAGWFQLWAEKRQRKTAEKLAAQQEKERLAKEAEDTRNQVALLKQLFERQYGGDIQALFAGNVQVPGTHPPAGTPAPTVTGVPSPAFVFPHGVSGSQPPPLVPDESMYGPSILDNLSYPRVEDTYEMSSVKSLSLMETNPPIFPASPPPANPSPIVGRVLSFDSMDDAAPLQPCSHPRLEDTYSVDIRPDSEGRMVDVPESQGLGTSEDRTGLNATLRNSSLDVCKDVLPHRGSSDDDDEDGGQDRREGGESGDHARVTTVDSIGTSDNLLSNSGGVSEYSGDEPLADKEGRLEDDLVDYESDPYESAMRDQAVAVDSIFHVQCHSQDPAL
jgi:hypothetical protein